MQPKAYLFFNGTAGDALAAYGAIFKTQPTMLMRMRDAPADVGVPPEKQDWVMHAELPIGGGAICLSDDFMGNSAAMDGCSVMLSYPTAAEARGVFDALADGGTVRMDFAPTFWTAGFGTLTDRFGTRWMIDCTEAPS